MSNKRLSEARQELWTALKQTQAYASVAATLLARVEDYLSEVMQERDELRESGKQMETLFEHEIAAMERRRPMPGGVGVKCDHCGTELVNHEPGVVLCSNPPKISVACPKCDWRGTMTV